jgi:septal ring factor EnvC (AmiA/AmiB activator)
MLQESVDESLKAMRRDIEASDRRLQRIEAKLDGLSSAVKSMDPDVEAALATEDDKARDNEKDRKRIKERLKEALETNYERAKKYDRKQNFMEYFFGICQSNGRVGKNGSRFDFKYNWHFLLALRGALR